MELNSPTDRDPSNLPRFLGPVGATLFVICFTIGTAIFLVPGIVARNAGSIPTSLIAWVAGGLISLCGALCYATVLSFRLAGNGGKYAALAVALPDELITELSRLRWLFIIARGSSFRLQTAGSDIREIGALLQVRYCLSGTVEVLDRNIVVAVELADTQDGSIVWTDRFSGRIDDVHVMRDDNDPACSWRSKFISRPTRRTSLATARLKISMPGPRVSFGTAPLVQV